MSDFDRGYACAISCIVAGHDISTEAKEALIAGGILSRKIAKQKGVDPYDMKVLNEILIAIESEQE